MSPKPSFTPINPPPTETEEEKNARRNKKYTLHAYQDAFPPNSPSNVTSYSSPYPPTNSSSYVPSSSAPYIPSNLSPYFPLSVFSNDLRPPPQRRIASATDGDGTVPPSDNATEQTSLDKSQPDDVETTPIQSTASQQQPVQPSPQPASNVYGDVPAMQVAIMGLAQLVHAPHLAAPGAYMQMITGRSADGQQVTAALLTVHPAAGGWTKLAGGEQYFETYGEAMMHILAGLEQRISSGLAAFNDHQIQAGPAT